MAVFTSWRCCIAQRWFAGLAPSHSIHRHHPKLVIHIGGQGQKGCGVIPWHSSELLPPPRLQSALFKLYNRLWGEKETKDKAKGRGCVKSCQQQWACNTWTPVANPMKYGQQHGLLPLTAMTVPQDHTINQAGPMRPSGLRSSSPTIT